VSRESRAVVGRCVLGGVLLVLAIAWDASVAVAGEPFNWQAPWGPYLMATAASVLLAWRARAPRRIACYGLCLAALGASGALATAIASPVPLALAPVLARAIIYVLLPFLGLVARIPGS
jgi:hypothetical protein